jgi:hypothetical protein
VSPLLALAVLLLGLGVAVLITRLLLGGIVRLAFRRARSLLRRLARRRGTERDTGERRQDERRAAP